MTSPPQHARGRVGASALGASSRAPFFWLQFFHYSQGQEYPGNYPPFKDRISWAGDLDKKDASISIENMQFIHNGTYICDVKNPPDIVAQPGHIRLYVVEKGTSWARLREWLSPLRRVSGWKTRLTSRGVCGRGIFAATRPVSGGLGAGDRVHTCRLKPPTRVRGIRRPALVGSQSHLTVVDGLRGGKKELGTLPAFSGREFHPWQKHGRCFFPLRRSSRNAGSGVPFRDVGCSAGEYMGGNSCPASVFILAH